jgi:hypothetical protein
MRRGQRQRRRRWRRRRERNGRKQQRKGEETQTGQDKKLISRVLPKDMGLPTIGVCIQVQTGNARLPRQELLTRL